MESVIRRLPESRATSRLKAYLRRRVAQRRIYLKGVIIAKSEFVMEKIKESIESEGKFIRKFHASVGKKAPMGDLSFYLDLGQAPINAARGGIKDLSDALLEGWGDKMQYAQKFFLQTVRKNYSSLKVERMIEAFQEGFFDIPNE